MSPRPRPIVAVLVASLALAAIGLVAQPALPRLVIGGGPVPVRAGNVTAQLRDTVDVALPFAASDVSLHWHGSPSAVVSLQLATTAGQFGEVIPIEADDASQGSRWPDENPVAGSDQTYSPVIWAAGARYARITSDRALGTVTVVAYQSDGPARPAVATQPQVVNAAVDAPPIITRAAWGANESYRFDYAGNELWPPSYYPLQTLIVHHTAGRNNDPNPAATIRAIYYDDAVIRGWGDMGYNFLIDAYGNIYEGRHARNYAAGEAHDGEDAAGNVARGAHAKNFNSGTLGIVLLGLFDTVLPTAAAQASLEKLLAWESDRHGINPLTSSLYVNPDNGTQQVLNHISGHRNVANTDCPGALFYPTFPTLRSHVASRIAATVGSSVDHTPPTVVSFKTLATTPTGGSSIPFGLIFSEPVTGLAGSSFTVGGSSNGWSVSSVNGAGSAYTVIVHANSPPAGTIDLGLKAGSVTDGGTNVGPASPASASATFADDTTKPTVTLTYTPRWAATAAKHIDIAVTFSEPVQPLTAADIAIGGPGNAGTPWTVDPVVGSGAHYGFTIENATPTNAVLTIAIPAGVTKDPAGNLNEASDVHSVLIDTIAPTTYAPTVRLRSGVSLSTTVGVTVAWSATDWSMGSGIATYDVARSYDGGAFAVVSSGLTGPALATWLASGHSYRYEARAHDRAGNVGGWAAGITVRGTLLQQWSSPIVYHGTYTTAYSSSYSGGSLRYMKTGGAYASLTTSARGLAFVTTRGPGRGSARIYVDGILVATVDLWNATYQYRYVAYAASWSALGTHTLRVVVVGTVGHPRVDIDAFEILR
jgi:hypothetical protein